MPVIGDSYSTNYFNTLIEIAPDSPVQEAKIPKSNLKKATQAEMEYEMVSQNPYKFTSDDVLFTIYATKNDLTASEIEEARAAYFAVGRACFRASPLPKRYGWGVHQNHEGKIALIGVETETYQTLLQDDSITKVKAMRSKRA